MADNKDELVAADRQSENFITRINHLMTAMRESDHKALRKTTELLHEEMRAQDTAGMKLVNEFIEFIDVILPKKSDVVE